MPRILVAGHITHDRYDDLIVPGGCAYYAAHVYAGLGADVHLATTVGMDFQCDDALRGISATVERAGETTVFTNDYPEGQPRVQLLEALAPAVTPEKIPSQALRADVIHLAPVLGEIDILAWKKVARSRFLAINVQGFVKGPGPYASDTEAGASSESARPHDSATSAARLVVQIPWFVNRDLLHGIHAACLSEEDLIDQGDLLATLCAAIPVVAVTRGSAGCDVIVEGKTARVGAYTTEVIDPTGAGDTFAAAFLYRYACGDDPLTAARWGAAAASIVIEEIGGRALGRVIEAGERVPLIH